MEQDEIKWDLFGLWEARRRGEQYMSLKSGHGLYYVGEADSYIGRTGCLIHRRHCKNLVSAKAVCTKVIYMTLKLSARYNITVIQVSASTSSHSEDQIDSFYDNTTLAFKEKRAHFTILRGVFSAKMGPRTKETEISLENFELEGRN
ncbi:uncharacterized protein LOC109538170 [Dendroctonus ponderosae]|uniref:GIY-YIG domain-containing protein n=1 Tax=Dendroctonus ponderosae TaxID=77166 RepID=A0AAR5PIW0_DENPD|nr:uncharacterized protein LOC109538170 [Dendroctonus ponderosae]KAH1024927.1 hypothetical protein HUJ05_009757 [Dendroctonus ponderosae]